MIGAAALPAVVFRPGYGPMKSRMNAKYAASLASSSVSATTSTRTPASWPVTAWLGSSAPRTASSPKIRVATRSRPSRTASANRGADRNRRLGRVGPRPGLREQGGLAHPEQAHRPEPLAPGPFHQHGVGRLDPAGTLAADAGRRLHVGRVGEVEEAARVLLLRRVGALVEGVRHQRADGRPGVRRRRPDLEPGLVQAGPETPARVAGLQREAAALQELAGEGGHGRRDTAQHRQCHEQTDVERPSGDDTVDAAVERRHHRLGADQGDDPLEPRGRRRR